MDMRAALLVALVGCAEPDPNDWHVTVFRGTSASGIEPGVEVPAIASNASCTGDFDGDGVPDLALAGPQRAQLLLMQAGTLVAQTPIEIPHVTSSYDAVAITCGDLDEDGNLDIAIEGNEPEGWTIKTFLGDGRGGLVSGAEVPSAWPFQLAAKDVNHDGHLDLVSASSEILTELGHGDGTYDPPVRSSVGIYAEAADLADLDGDGLLDIVLTSYFPDGLLEPAGTAISVLRGRGDGTFGDERSYEAGEGTLGVLVAPLDADASPDVLVTTESDGIRVLHGDGHGAFGSARDIAKAGSFGRWIAAHDFDNDGRLDVASLARGRIAIFHSDEDGSFSQASAQEIARDSLGLSIVDVDGDGTMDLVALDVPEYRL